MHAQRKTIVITALLIVLAITGLSQAQKYHPTSPEVNYKCLFNHDGMIAYTFLKDKDPETTGPAYIGSFIEKLKDTDVDVVLVSPNAGRCLAYPSKINPMWKKYCGGIEEPRRRGHGYLMNYICEGGDPVRDALEAARRADKDFFLSYRMNEAHNIVDVNYPTHDDFWRNHPEYWLGDSDISITWKWQEDNVRMHNYMLKPVRDWYFSILEECCTFYDVDGLELDFQRAPRFFYNHEREKGKQVMTGFVRRVREMLNRLGKERNQSIKLCVRVPETLDKCDYAGLDVVRWDELKLIDMINISPYYLHSLNVDIEGFRSKTKNAKLYAELEGWSQAIYVRGAPYHHGSRLTPLECYRAAALNFLARGVDGISFFNYDYVPHGAPSLHDKRVEASKGLVGITDMDYLKTLPKVYVMVPFQERLMLERNQGVKDEFTEEVLIPDDPSKVSFSESVLRVETADPCEDLEIAVWMNGKRLPRRDYDGTELSEPVYKTPHGYPTADKVKFYKVELSDIITGNNKFEVRNLDKAKRSCEIFSLELALL